MYNLAIILAPTLFLRNFTISSLEIKRKRDSSMIKYRLRCNIYFLKTQYNNDWNNVFIFEYNSVHIFYLLFNRAIYENFYFLVVLFNNAANIVLSIDRKRITVLTVL